MWLLYMIVYGLALLGALFVFTILLLVWVIYDMCRDGLSRAIDDAFAAFDQMFK